MDASSSNLWPGRLLVIFGCGYVGSAVAGAAVAGGARVTALTRNAAKAQLLREQGIEAVVADLASEAWHAAVPARPDFVLNAVSSGGGGVEGYQHSYVDGMDSILRWARSRGAAGTMVYTSSTSVYPQGGGVVVDEAASVDGGEAGERPRLLRTAEQRLMAGGGDVCARWFILRLAGIYGPGRTHLVEQVRAGEASGRGENHLNLIHRDDAAAAIAACFGAEPAVRNEVFNVADDAPAPKAEVVAWLAQRLGVDAPKFTGEPAGGRKAVTPDRMISNRKIVTTLGWRPAYRSYRDGYGKME